MQAINFPTLRAIFYNEYEYSCEVDIAYTNRMGCKWF